MSPTIGLAYVRHFNSKNPSEPDLIDMNGFMYVRFSDGNNVFDVSIEEGVLNVHGVNGRFALITNSSNDWNIEIRRI